MKITFTRFYKISLLAKASFDEAITGKILIPTNLIPSLLLDQQCTSQHFTEIHGLALNSNAPHCIQLNYTTLLCTVAHCKTEPDYKALHTLYRTVLQYNQCLKSPLTLGQSCWDGAKEKKQIFSMKLLTTFSHNFSGYLRGLLIRVE